MTAEEFRLSLPYPKYIAMDEDDFAKAYAEHENKALKHEVIDEHLAASQLKNKVETLQEKVETLKKQVEELEDLLKLTGGKCKRYLPKEVKERLAKTLKQ